MTKYRVTVYPNVESDTYDVEEENIDYAIESAEDLAKNNCFFSATESDVEILEDDL